MLTNHGWQSSEQGHVGDATRGGGSGIAVIFCTLHYVLSAGCRRSSRQTEALVIGHAKGED